MPSSTETTPTIRVADAVSPEQLDAVRTLMRSFVAWHRERHVEQRALIDEYFDAAAFDDELQTLPGVYARPAGRLLIATVDGEAAGCVALRPIDSTACEMKRMFVYPRFHGTGVGRALAERLVAEARAAGYRAMRLDTSVRQEAAQGLYRRLGFRTVEPHEDLPDRLRGWLVFMELAL